MYRFDSQRHTGALPRFAYRLGRALVTLAAALPDDARRRRRIHAPDQRLRPGALTDGPERLLSPPGTGIVVLLRIAAANRRADRRRSAHVLQRLSTLRGQCDADQRLCRQRAR